MSALGEPRITPFLWFESEAAPAAEFYVGVFPNSRQLGGLQGPGGVPITVSFELDGQRFTALNGGPGPKFSGAVSFVVRCETQQEVDYYWERLLEGGAAQQCGWLTDRFGVSWQVVPARLPELLQSAGAMQAMLKMTKLDIAELERAARS